MFLTGILMVLGQAAQAVEHSEQAALFSSTFDMLVTGTAFITIAHPFLTLTFTSQHNKCSMFAAAGYLAE